MTIEVRQLLIRSSVEAEHESGHEGGDAAPDEDQQRRLREELLAECKAWLLTVLADERER